MDRFHFFIRFFFSGRGGAREVLKLAEMADDREDFGGKETSPLAQALPATFASIPPGRAYKMAGGSVFISSASSRVFIQVFPKCTPLYNTKPPCIINNHKLSLGHKK